MKLKSLLLGSAAVLALSTGAQAADPMTEFVSLGVCDAYGITGLTIESDDTCLLISGEVEYEYVNEVAGGAFSTSSTVDWELAFEATTQTDAGAAVAKITFINAVVDSGADTIDGVEVDEAYVQFGDTTVLSAGKKGSLFDRELVDDLFTIDDETTGNGEEELLDAVATGGHVIQIESLVADGFTVMASLEDLQEDGEGTAGLGAKYDNGGISGELGVLLGDIYGDADLMNYYGKISADLDAFALSAGFLADSEDYWVATVGAEAAFDMFSLNTEAYFDADDQWGIAGEGSFAATDTIDIYVGASYEEITVALGTPPVDTDGERFQVYGGANADVTETIEVNAELGYVEDTARDEEYMYGILGATYTPGGNFETSLEAEVRDNEDYSLTFNANKSF